MNQGSSRKSKKGSKKSRGKKQGSSKPMSEFDLLKDELKGMDKSMQESELFSSKTFNRKISIKKNSSGYNDDGQKFNDQSQKKGKLKKMLAPKLQKSGYVRKKNLNLSYKPPDFQTKKVKVNYDLRSVLRTINNCHGWDTISSKWAISTILKNRSSLQPKGQQILSSNKFSETALLRIMNLRNQIPEDLKFDLNEKIIDEIYEMDENDKYENLKHPVMLEDWVYFLNYESEHKNILTKSIEVFKKDPNLKKIVRKINLKEKPKNIVEELDNLLEETMSQKYLITLQVDNKKTGDLMTKIADICSRKISEFLFHKLAKARRTFIKLIKDPVLVEVINSNYASQDEMKQIFSKERLNTLLMYYRNVLDLENQFQHLQIPGAAIGTLGMVYPPILDLLENGKLRFNFRDNGHDFLRYLLAERTFNDANILKVSAKDLVKFFGELSPEQRMLLEEDIVNMGDMENAGFHPIGPNFKDYIKRVNERASFSVQASKKSRRTIPVPKNYKEYNVDIQERTLTQLLFADEEKGPASFLDYLKRNQKAIPSITTRAFRRLADLYELTQDEIDTLIAKQMGNNSAVGDSMMEKSMVMDVSTALDDLEQISGRSRRVQFDNWVSYIRSEQVDGIDTNLYTETEDGQLMIIGEDGIARPVGGDGNRYKLLPDQKIYYQDPQGRVFRIDSPDSHVEITDPRGRIVLGKDCNLYLMTDDGRLAVYRGPEDTIDLGETYKLDQDFNLCKIGPNGEVNRVMEDQEVSDLMSGKLGETLFLDENGLITTVDSKSRNKKSKKDKKKKSSDPLSVLLKSMDPQELEELRQLLGVKEQSSEKELIKKLKKKLVEMEGIDKKDEDLTKDQVMWLCRDKRKEKLGKALKEFGEDLPGLGEHFKLFGGLNPDQEEDRSNQKEFLSDLEIVRNLVKGKNNKNPEKMMKSIKKIRNKDLRDQISDKYFDYLMLASTNTDIAYDSRFMNTRGAKRLEEYLESNPNEYEQLIDLKDACQFVDSVKTGTELAEISNLTEILDGENDDKILRYLLAINQFNAFPCQQFNGESASMSLKTISQSPQFSLRTFQLPKNWVEQGTQPQEGNPENEQPIFKLKKSDLFSMHIDPTKLRGLTFSKDGDILINKEVALQLLGMAKNQIRGDSAVDILNLAKTLESLEVSNVQERKETLMEPSLKHKMNVVTKYQSLIRMILYSQEIDVGENPNLVSLIKANLEVLVAQPVMVNQSDFRIFDQLMFMKYKDIMANYSQISSYLEKDSLLTVQRIKETQKQLLGSEDSQLYLILKKNRLKGRFHFKFQSKYAINVLQYLLANGVKDEQFEREIQRVTQKETVFSFSEQAAQLLQGDILSLIELSQRYSLSDPSQLNNLEVLKVIEHALTLESNQYLSQYVLYLLYNSSRDIYSVQTLGGLYPNSPQAVLHAYHQMIKFIVKGQVHHIVRLAKLNSISQEHRLQFSPLLDLVTATEMLQDPRFDQLKVNTPILNSKIEGSRLFPIFQQFSSYSQINIYHTKYPQLFQSKALNLRFPNLT